MDVLNLEINNRGDELLTFNLYNSSGFQVITLEIGENETSTKVELTDIPEGIYFYSLSQKDKILTTNKLVKL